MGDQYAPTSSRNTRGSKDPFDEDEEEEEEREVEEEEEEFTSPFDGMDSISSNNIRIYVRKFMHILLHYSQFLTLFVPF